MLVKRYDFDLYDIAALMYDTKVQAKQALDIPISPARMGWLHITRLYKRRGPSLPRPRGLPSSATCFLQTPPVRSARGDALLLRAIRPKHKPDRAAIPRALMPCGDAFRVKLGRDARKAEALLAQREDPGDGGLGVIGGGAALLGAGCAYRWLCLGWGGTAGHIEETVVAVLHLMQHLLRLP
jgi:hypothetical protein